VVDDKAAPGDRGPLRLALQEVIVALYLGGEIGPSICQKEMGFPIFRIFAGGQHPSFSFHLAAFVDLSLESEPRNVFLQEAPRVP
jgi:hypothetical protein